MSGYIQNAPRCDPVQPALGQPALAEGAGLGDLQGSLPTPTIQWFYGGQEALKLSIKEEK